MSSILLHILARFFIFFLSYDDVVTYVQNVL